MNAPRRSNRGKDKTKATGNAAARDAGGSADKYKSATPKATDQWGQSVKSRWGGTSSSNKKWGN